MVISIIELTRRPLPGIGRAPSRAGTGIGTGLWTENYTRDRLNQHTQKDEAATFDVLALANVSTTVKGRLQT